MIAAVEALLAMLLKDWLTPVTVQVGEDALTGKLIAPTKTLVEAQADPVDTERAENFVASYEATH